MSQSDALFAELMRKVREVWAFEDDERQAYLLRELEALIYRYQETQRGA
jgi:hypothetical protein